MGKQKEAMLTKLSQMARKNRELEAQLVHVYHFASMGIARADRNRTMGSGVQVTLTYLGGAEVCPSFVLKDGLSEETIAALQADILYSYNKTIEFKPKGAS